MVDFMENPKRTWMVPRVLFFVGRKSKPWPEHLIVVNNMLMVEDSINIINNNSLLTDWWFGTFFFHILGIIIPTDQYFLEGLKPPTSKMWYFSEGLMEAETFFFFRFQHQNLHGKTDGCSFSCPIPNSQSAMCTDSIYTIYNM